MTLPDWRPAAQHPRLPAYPLSDWLQSEGSLTRRLTAAGNQDFRVEPLDQGVQPARSDEAQALDIPAGTPVWAREVLLHTAGAPRVFARSVAPLEVLEDSGVDLANLGTRSLGELLFNDARIARGPIEVSLYPSEWLPAAWRAEGLWARRSCFSAGHLQLLVCEVFLDGWPPAG